MSIAEQITRIQNEVSSQKDIINEIDTQIIGKKNYITDLNGLIDGEATTITNPYIRQIRPYAFYSHENLQDGNFEKASIIKNNAFQACKNLQKINAPNVVLVESYAFEGCDNPFNINMPKLQKIIDRYSFQYSGIQNIDFPLIQELPQYAFYNCPHLTNASLLSIEKLSSSCFAYSSLQSINALNVQKIQNNALHNTNISTIDFPVATEIGNGAFSYCTKLNSVNLPLVEILNGSTFFKSAINSNMVFPALKQVQTQDFAHTQLTEITDNNFPVLEDIKGFMAFGYINSLTTINSSSIKRISINSAIPCISYNDNLQTVILPSVEEIGDSAFYSCLNLTDVYLLGSYVVMNTQSFQFCPNVNIWVPNDLYEDYMAVHIDTALDNYIWPVTNEMFKARTINSAAFSGDTVSVSIPCRNVTSTPSITITCSNCSYSNLNIGEKAITFDITMGSADAVCSYVITADSGTYTGSFNYHIYVDSDFSYTVTNRSSTYGFYLNDSDYYESNNKGINSSYAVCRVNLYNNYNSGQMPTTVYIDCINSGEANYDFGIIGKQNCSLSLSTSVDSSSYYIKSFKGSSSTSVQTVTYSNFGGSGGYFDIKYRKDGSVNSGNDSLQFKIRFS